MKFKTALALLSLLLLNNDGFGAKVLPVLNNPLPNLSTLPNSAGQTIDLDSIFGTEAIDDQVVRFTTQSSIGSLTLDFALFSNRTPGTRTNFLNYVNDGDYDNSIIHRSVPGFVIQGGGFYDSDPTTSYSIASVPTDAPITNEFGISNTLGTVSMAKVGGDPDSATSQWFVSLGDNSTNLDNQNGGFTVFARVTKSTLANATTIGSFKIWDASGGNPLSPFSSLPLSPDFTGGTIQQDDFVLFTTVELVDIAESDAGMSTTLTYSIVGNTNPGVVSASIINGSDLQLSYSTSETGISEITIRAADSVGNIVEDSFTVVLTFQSYDAWRNFYFDEVDSADPEISGPDVDANGDGLTNLELYLHGLSRNGFFPNQVQFSDYKFLNARYATFSFPILSNISDIDISLEQSSDMGLTDDWSPVSFSETSRTGNGHIDTVSIRANTPAASPNDFYRIRYSQAP